MHGSSPEHIHVGVVVVQPEAISERLPAGYQLAKPGPTPLVGARLDIILAKLPLNMRIVDYHEANWAEANALRRANIVAPLEMADELLWFDGLEGKDSDGLDRIATLPLRTSPDDASPLKHFDFDYHTSTTQPRWRAFVRNY